MSLFSNISRTYGERCVAIFRQATKESMRIVKLEETTRFLRSCFATQVIPRSLWFHLPLNYESDAKLKWRVSKLLLRKAISDIQRQLRHLKSEKNTRLACLKMMLSNADFTGVREFIWTGENRCRANESSHFSQRLERLVQISNRSETMADREADVVPPVTNSDSSCLHVSSQTIASNLSSCCLLYTSPSPRDLSTSRMPSSA